MGNISHVGYFQWVTCDSYGKYGCCEYLALCWWNLYNRCLVHVTKMNSNIFQKIDSVKLVAHLQRSPNMLRGLTVEPYL